MLNIILRSLSFLFHQLSTSFFEVVKIPIHEPILKRTVEQNRDQDELQVGFIELAEDVQTDLPSPPKKEDIPELEREMEDAQVVYDGCFRTIKDRREESKRQEDMAPPCAPSSMSFPAFVAKCRDGREGQRAAEDVKRALADALLFPA